MCLIIPTIMLSEFRHIGFIGLSQELSSGFLLVIRATPERWATRPFLDMDLTPPRGKPAISGDGTLDASRATRLILSPGRGHPGRVRASGPARAAKEPESGTSPPTARGWMGPSPRINLAPQT